MADTALAAVGIGTAQFLLVHLFVGHSLHHIGTGDEHMALLLHHEDEIGKRRRIARTAGARAENGRNLRNHSRSNGVLVEDGGISRNATHPFLDAGTSRVVEGNHRCPVAQGQLLHLLDLPCSRLAQRTAVDGKVVGIDIDQTSVNLSVATHNAIAWDMVLFHPEIGAMMNHQFVHFVERTLVEQGVDTFTCGHVAVGMLAFDAFDTTAQRSRLVEFLEFLILFHVNCFILLVQARCRFTPSLPRDRVS